MITAIAFDVKAPTFRHEMYSGYKANRKGMPPELAQQMPPLKELLAAMGYIILEAQGWEADDILGTLAANCKENDFCYIATGDRDSLQLVRDNVNVLLASTKMGRPQSVRYDREKIKEEYPNLNVVGSHHGYFKDEEEQEIVDEIIEEAIEPEADEIIEENIEPVEEEITEAFEDVEIPQEEIIEEAIEEEIEPEAIINDEVVEEIAIESQTEAIDNEIEEAKVEEIIENTNCDKGF